MILLEAMYKLVGMICILVFVTSCALEGQAQNNLVNRKTTTIDDELGEQIYKVLMAEFYSKEHQYAQAANYFFDIALKNNNLFLSERATKMAVFSGDVDRALIVARHWAKLGKLSGQKNKASHYISLLLLYKKKYVEAAKELYTLEQSLDKQPISSSVNPLKLTNGQRDIVEMLKRDNSPSKVFETYRQYATRYYPNNYAVSLALASFAMADNRYGAAIQAAEKASKSPNRIIYRKARLIYINALSEQGKDDEATIELSQLIENSADDQTKQVYARLLASLGQENEAITVLNKIYGNNKKNISVLRDMISLHLDKANYTEAEKLVIILMRNEYQQTTANYFYGRIYEARQDFDSALKHYYKSLDTRTYYIDVRARIVELLDKNNRLSEAFSFLHDEQKKAVGQGDIADLYQMESVLLERVGRYREAIKVIKKAFDASPNYSSALQYSSALLHQRLGDIAQAETILLNVINHDASNSAALNALGYMLLVKTDRLDEAEEYIEKAYEIRPEDPAIIDSLGWIHYKKGNFERAEAYLRQAYLELRDPEVAGHLIEVLTAKGEIIEAKEVLREMIERYPDDMRLKKVKDKVIGMRQSND